MAWQRVESISMAVSAAPGARPVSRAAVAADFYSVVGFGSGSEYREQGSYRRGDGGGVQPLGPSPGRSYRRSLQWELFSINPASSLFLSIHLVLHLHMSARGNDSGNILINPARFMGEHSG